MDEEANAAADLEKRVALQSRILDTLVQVEHALQKLDEGTYGLCDSCEQPINPARLEALPLAALCVNCKALQKG
jgi:RNA polymerase-binding transcription factor DksA